MSVERTGRRVEIGTSVMNLFDSSMLYTAAWPIRAFADFANEAGYDGGLEWHPVRGIAAGLQSRLNLLSDYERQSIQSLHQSWLSEKSIGEAWSHPNRGLALISYVLLTEKNKSLTDLEQLQKVVGEELPVVLYPDSINSGTDQSFSKKLFQPKPDVLQLWSVNSVEEMISEMYRRGYTGLCLDLFHMRATHESGITLNPWQETLPLMLPHTQEIHVAAGRSDITQSQIDTDAELNDLLQGSSNSELAQMLAEAANQNWSGRIVTEVPAMSLHTRRLQRGKFASIPLMIEDHRELVHHIHQLMAS